MALASEQPSRINGFRYELHRYTAREGALRFEQKVVRASEQKEQPLRVAFMGIDAFWSLFGVLSQLQKWGSDCDE